MRNLSVSRGVGTGLSGLFVYMIVFCMALLYYTFIAAVVVVAVIVVIVKHVVQRRKAKKLGKTMDGMPTQPMPVMAPVNPRNWTPPAE